MGIPRREKCARICCGVRCPLHPDPPRPDSSEPRAMNRPKVGRTLHLLGGFLERSSAPDRGWPGALPLEGLPPRPPGSHAGGRDSGRHRRAPGHHLHLTTTPPRHPSVQEQARLDRANRPVLPHCLIHRPASPLILSADTSPPDRQPCDDGRLSTRSPLACPRCLAGGSTARYNPHRLAQGSGFVQLIFSPPVAGRRLSAAPRALRVATGRLKIL